VVAEANGVDLTSVYVGRVYRTADVSIGIDTTGSDRITISYDSSAVNLDVGEQFFFEVSYDGGTNWSTVLSGGDHAWTTRTHDLSTFSAGQCNNNPNFAIRFRIDASQVSEIFYVDNVVASGCVIGTKMMFVGEGRWIQPETTNDGPSDTIADETDPVADSANAAASDRWKAILEAAIEARIQQERAVYLQNDSWMQTAQPGDWAGLIFNAPNRSMVENAVVEFAQRAIQISGAADGAVELRDCAVRSNWLGVLCSNSYATIVGTHISGNVIDAQAAPLPGGINPSGSGLICIGTSRPVVSFSTFADNEINSIGILGFARPSLGEISGINSPGRNEYRLPRGQNHIFNGTTQTIYAQLCTFERQAGESVEDTIFDDTDDPALGPIIWEPLLGTSTGVEGEGWASYR